MLHPANHSRDLREVFSLHFGIQISKHKNYLNVANLLKFSKETVAIFWCGGVYVQTTKYSLLIK